MFVPMRPEEQSNRGEKSQDTLLLAACGGLAAKWAHRSQKIENFFNMFAKHDARTDHGARVLAEWTGKP